METCEITKLNRLILILAPTTFIQENGNKYHMSSITKIIME